MNRAQLLAAMAVTAKPKIISVEVAGWGALHVRPPTVEEVDAATEQEQSDKGGKKHRFARSAARIICDADGALLFDPAKTEDVEVLASQPWAMLQKVLAAADPDKALSSGN